jgi:hypothetical protein
LSEIDSDLLDRSENEEDPDDLEDDSSNSFNVHHRISYHIDKIKNYSSY